MPKKLEFYKSLFYRAWRPSLGWISVLGLLVAFIIYPLTKIIYTIATGDTLDLEYNTDNLLALVSTALGTAGIRSYDKAKEQSIKPTIEF